MTVSMLKEMLRVELSPEGAEALATIMRVTGLKRTQVIHMVLAEVAQRMVAQSGGLAAGVESAPMWALNRTSEVSVQKLKEVKREAKLKEIIEEALPQRSSEEILASAQARIEAQRG